VNWDYPQPFERRVQVAPEHIDALEHANNTVYVNWCMDTAWAHTTALGLGADDYQALDRAMALTRAEYDYLRAARLGDELAVGTWITRWDRRLTMERRIQIIDLASGETALRARLDFVCIEISSGKPKRPPKAFIEGYEPALIDH
jgi:acyl-CoA thioester hydrolase